MDSSLGAESLEISDMCEHAVLLPLQLLQVASTFRASSHAVRDVTLEVQVDAVRAALGQGIASNLSDLASVASLAGAGIRLKAILDDGGEVLRPAVGSGLFRFPAAEGSSVVVADSAAIG